MKPTAAYIVSFFLMFSMAGWGCKNPCQDEIDALRERVMAFIEDSDPSREGAQRCVTDQNNIAEYDQICDFAMKALDTRWPYYDCNSCDAIEIKLCGCFRDQVWAISEEARLPTYPGVVYCLANYYRIRDLCACDPDCERQHGGSCNLAGRSIRPGGQEICGDKVDQNCDGIDPPCDCEDLDFDGYRDAECGGEDCNDGASFIFPGAPETPELCANDADENCDGVQMTCGCVDEDEDGYYSAVCGGNDCNDNDENIHPGAPERCGDGVDQDCNGVDLICCPDLDGDGAKDSRCGGPDCDDDDDGVFPGAREVCDDNIDQDCNGSDLACGCTDADGDGFIDATCGGDDCNDNEASINPQTRETCGDGIDQDCNGADLSCDCPDADGDLYHALGCGGDDCDDSNARINPGMEEICGNGIDDDCSGSDLTPCDCPDVDGDGFHDMACGGSDCMDASFYRVCDVDDRPQVTQHNLQQTDICDALLETFACEHYDGDGDGIPDQYDGGQDRDAQYTSENPECLNGPPINACDSGRCAIGGQECKCDNDCAAGATWDQWFTEPLSLFEGGEIYIDADGDGDPDDSDRDGVSDSCDNCVNTRNGFDCKKVVEEQRPFEKYCDSDLNGVVSEEELAWGSQKDTNNDGIGDACDIDSDGMLNETDNCPNHPNGYECLSNLNLEDHPDFCDHNENGIINIEDLRELDDLDQRDCLNSINEWACFVGNCDADGNGSVTMEELEAGQQEDSDADGVGDACDNCRHTRNGYNCLDPLFEDNCDINEDGRVTDTEKSYGDQRDDNGNGVGDACE